MDLKGAESSTPNTSSSLAVDKTATRESMMSPGVARTSATAATGATTAEANLNTAANPLANPVRSALDFIVDQCSRNKNEITGAQKTAIVRAFLVGVHDEFNPTFGYIDLPTFVQENQATLTFPEKLMLMLTHMEREYSKRLHVAASTGSQVKSVPCPPIVWVLEGKAFSVRNKKQLVSDVLPQFFRESKYTSFTRKLYRWGFRQISLTNERVLLNKRKRMVGGDKMEMVYTQEYFQRDNKPLMSKMRSVTTTSKAKKQALSTDTDAAASTMTAKREKKTHLAETNVDESSTGQHDGAPALASTFNNAPLAGSKSLPSVTTANGNAASIGNSEEASTGKAVVMRAIDHYLQTPAALSPVPAQVANPMNVALAAAATTAYQQRVSNLLLLNALQKQREQQLQQTLSTALPTQAALFHNQLTLAAAGLQPAVVQFPARRQGTTLQGANQEKEAETEETHTKR